jgi:hypothetical protein
MSHPITKQVRQLPLRLNLPLEQGDSVATLIVFIQSL